MEQQFKQLIEEGHFPSTIRKILKIDDIDYTTLWNKYRQKKELDKFKKELEEIWDSLIAIIEIIKNEKDPKEKELMERIFKRTSELYAKKLP